MGLKAMPRRALLETLQRAFAGGLRAKRTAFLRDASRMESIQGEKLKAFLAANASSRYGRERGYEGITSVEAFQRHVPVVDYDALASRVDAVAAGAQGELSTEPVLMLERTGGSTATNKWIPYTSSLKNEFSEATDVWMADLYANVPGLYGTTCYFAISPVGSQPRVSEGGLPIGFEDDAEYFHPLARWAWRRMMSVPARVARESDMDAWRFATCRFLLADPLLGLLSVWSPTFLTNLLSHIERHFDALLARLPRDRALVLEAARKRASREGRSLRAREIWPRLALVSCWTDGISQAFAEPLRAFCGNDVVLQPKGLLATEGVVSFPLRTGEARGDVNVAAYKSHFLEFLDLGTDAGDDLSALKASGRRPLLVHELRPGGLYSPLLTTGNGFARYHLKDVVTCTGHWAGLPCLRFEGKADRTADLFGEKINMRQVEHGLALARERTGAGWRFALLAPTPPHVLGPEADPAVGGWHYVLYIESDAQDAVLEALVRVLESHLATGHHYAYCRSLGQLGPMRWRRVSNGQEAFEASLASLGSRSGTIKPAVLDTRTHWHSVFPSP